MHVLYCTHNLSNYFLDWLTVCGLIVPTRSAMYPG